MKESTTNTASIQGSFGGGDVSELLDSEAIDKFKVAYQCYAGALGTNTAIPVAIGHMVDENGNIQVYTLHIRLAGMDQTVYATLLLVEESLEEIDQWLINEFDIDLEREHPDGTFCDLMITDREVVIEEEIIALNDLDIEVRNTHLISVDTSMMQARALLMFFKACGIGAPPEKLTVYHVQAGAECTGCGKDMAIVIGVAEHSGDGDRSGGREMFRHDLHIDEYNEYTMYLDWLTRQLPDTMFSSLNHECDSEADLLNALKKLHSVEIENFDLIMKEVGNLFTDMAERSSDEGSSTDSDCKRTLH